MFSNVMLLVLGLVNAFVVVGHLHAGTFTVLHVLNLAAALACIAAIIYTIMLKRRSGS